MRNEEKSHKPGEHDLTTLIREMRPRLHPDTFAFATFATERDAFAADLQPIAWIREEEGMTAILPVKNAVRAGIPFTFPCRMITLEVHSSLDAVGFIARVTAWLAGHGMGCNTVSGYHHDHLFVPADRADEAMTRLAALARQDPVS